MGQPFSVFTPYKNAWLQRLDAFYVKPYPITPYVSHLALVPSPSDLPSLASLGFTQTNLSALGVAGGSGAARVLLDDFLTRIDAYDQRRDYPAVKGPSYLSVHLRFGTLSIRELVTLAKQRQSSGAAVWLSELIWRDFYFMILARHPRVVNASRAKHVPSPSSLGSPRRMCTWKPPGIAPA
jgi:deoxyribodipyrimidine photo-lyase